MEALLFMVDNERRTADETAPLQRSRRIQRLAAVSLLALVAACAVEDGDEGTRDFEQAPPEPVGESSSALVGYDCATRADTGYSNGKAFPITVVTVDGKPVEEATANAFLTMAKAAEGAGITLRINSGFRTMAEQQYFYNCYLNKNCNNGNLAAKPGYSNHQSGHALDLNTGGGALGWLNAHGGEHGFKRTVPSEDWHWEWVGGGSPQIYCGNAAPTGYLDEASCEQIKGWAFDKEAGAGAIGTHLYFGGPAGSGAPALALVAGQERTDLCGVVGSCNHGYSTRPPLSLLDGQPRPVHAYAIDSAGGANPELGSSPRELKCLMPMPAGITRWVTNPVVLGAWKLDLFFDKLPVDAAIVDAVPRGTDVPGAPVLASAEGDPKVYLLDGKTKRWITSPSVMEAWRFDWAAIQKKPLPELQAIADGPDVRARPVAVVDSAGRVLLVDDGEPLPPPAAGGGAGGTSAAGGKSAGGSFAGGENAGGKASGEGGQTSATGGKANAAGSPTGGSSSSGSSAGAAGKASGAAGKATGAGGAAGKSTGNPASDRVAIEEPSDQSGACAVAVAQTSGPSKEPPGALVVLGALAAAWRGRRARRHLAL